MRVTLFLIKINNVTSNLKPPIKLHLFTDDTTITCSRQNIHSINEHMQISILSRIDQIRLIYNSYHTKPKAFTRKSEHQLFPKLLLRNTEIIFVATIKLLDFIFDQKLSRVPYLKSLKDSCTIKLNIIETLSNNN